MFKVFGAFILLLALAAPVQSAVIDYSGQVQARDITAIPWVAGSTMWGSIETANGIATNAVDFKSLIGLDIGLFQFSFGDLELVKWKSPGAITPWWEFYSEEDLSVQPVLFYYNEVEWASGSLNFLQTEVLNNSDVYATGFGSLNLESGTAEGMTFYTEVMALSSGTGLMDFTIDSFSPVNNSGLFNSSGTLSVSPVPNPPAMVLFLLGLAILFGVRRRALILHNYRV